MLMEDKERLAREAGMDLDDTKMREGPRRMAQQPLTPRAIKEHDDYTTLTDTLTDTLTRRNKSSCRHRASTNPTCMVVRRPL